MKIAISVESTADLGAELVKKNKIYVIPFHVFLNEDDFRDGVDITTQELFDFADRTGTLPRTSAIPDFEFEQFFSEILKENDAIIHFSLSSGLSSSCENATRIAKNFKNVYVINSLSLSSGIGLLALAACDKIKEGKDVKQIVSEIEELVSRVKASFIINNLKYLYKGGRCSALALLGANLLKIKPEIKLLNGKMVVGNKYRGKHEEVLINYVQDTLKNSNPDKTRAFITFSSWIPIVPKINEMLKTYGFKEVHETFASATICSHCGPQTLGILFINKD